MYEQIKENHINRIKFTHMCEKKFKTSVLSITFSIPLGKQNSLSALLPNVLIRGTQNYENFSKISKKLDSLYGSRILPIIRKSGSTLAIGFIVDIIDERFINDNLTQQVIQLLIEIIKKPAIQNNLLIEEYVNSEKQNLIDKISRLKSNTKTYVVRRMKEIMYENEPFGLCEYGTIEEIENITPKSLTQHLKYILQNSPIQIFYCGSLEKEYISKLFLSEFENKKYSFKILNPKNANLTKNPKTIQEKMSVSQGKLAMGFRSNIFFDNEKYPAFMLFSYILGGYTGSRLFRYIREKLSLCYYISSSIDKYTGCLTVTSGVDTKNSELVQDEILMQIKDIQNGNINNQEIEFAKKVITDNLKSMYDNPLYLENFFQSAAMNGIDICIEKLYKDISNVNSEQIKDVSNMIKLDTIYFIKGGDL